METDLPINEEAANSRKGAASGSAFTIHDLKCGNILNYDTGEEGIAPTVIDWQDLQWLTEDTKGFNLVHSPIKLSKDIIEKIGFKILEAGRQDHFRWEYRNIKGHFYKNKGFYIKNFSGKMDYFHELQNFYYSITGVMLSLN